MPAGLKKLVPGGFEPAKADYVVLDRAGIDKTNKGAKALDVQLLEAYTRALGTEAVSLKISALPKKLHPAAAKLTKKKSLTGAMVLKALEQPEKSPAPVNKALPAIAALLHEEMGRQELSKGRLSAGLGAHRVDEAELSLWFAAGVAEIRKSAGKKSVGIKGAERLIQLTKQVMLNRGGGLVTRAFFDAAVIDLHAAVGLNDKAIAKLNTFRVQTQPGRTSHKRTKQGALVQIDEAARKKAEVALLNPTQAKADLTRDVDFLVIEADCMSTPYGAKLLKLAKKIGATVKYTDGSAFHIADPTD